MRRSPISSTEETVISLIFASVSVGASAENSADLLLKSSWLRIISRISAGLPFKAKVFEKAKEYGWTPEMREAKNRYLYILASSKAEKRHLLKMCKLDLHQGKSGVI